MTSKMENEPVKQSCGAGFSFPAMAFEGLRLEALKRKCVEWGGEEEGEQAAKNELIGAKTEPKGSPEETKREPKWRQNRSWDPPGVPLGTPGAKEGAPRPSKRHFGIILDILREPPEPTWELEEGKKSRFG